MEPRSQSPAPSLTPSTQRSRFPQRLRFKNPAENAHLSISTAASTTVNISTFPIADPTHVLAQEILQACHAARFYHVSRQLLPSSRRPYSVQSSTTASSTSTISLPSLRQLHQVLLNASSTSAATHARLPHESQVISACLSRFLAAIPDNQGEEEKLLALACWDILIRSWMTESPLTRAVSLLKAAIPQTPQRTRVLFLLSSVLSHPLTSKPSHANRHTKDPTRSLPPSHLLALTEGLTMLQSIYPHASNEATIVTGLLANLVPQLNPDDLTKEYGSEWSWDQDDNSTVIRTLRLEGAVRGLEGTSGGERWWGLIEEQWPVNLPKPTPLQQAIWNRIVSGLTRSLLRILSLPASPPQPPHRQDAARKAMTRLALIRIIPAVERYALDEQRASVVRVVLEFGMDGSRVDNVGLGLEYETAWSVNEDRASEILCDWWDAQDTPNGTGGDGTKWKAALETAVKTLIWNTTPAEPSTVTTTRLLSTLLAVLKSPTSRKAFVAFLLPHLFEHLTAWKSDEYNPQPPTSAPTTSPQPPSTSPPTTTPPQTSAPHTTPPPKSTSPSISYTPVQALPTFLQTLSRAHPQAFFKPVFALVAATAPLSVCKHLDIIGAISRCLPNWWRQNAEIISVAFLSDPASSKLSDEDASDPNSKKKGKGKAREAAPRWSTGRLGQAVLIVEIMTRVRAVRLKREEEDKAEGCLFVGLDGLVSDRRYQGGDDALIETVKFVTALEARLSILIEVKEKQTMMPPSLRRLYCKLFLEMRLLMKSLSSRNATFLPLVVNWLLDAQSHGQGRIDREAERELRETADQLRSVYETVGDASAQHFHNGHHSTANVHDPSRPAFFASQREFVEALSPTNVEMLQLLVALSGSLSAYDYRRMGRTLWEGGGLDSRDGRVIAPTCFLVMQCAEKTEDDFLDIVKSDMRSPEPAIKLIAIRRIDTLINWRFQLSSQPVITDRTYRRPFKMLRGPLPFVATDMGSNVYVRETDVIPLANPNAKGNATLPLEVRKRLAEIGWTEEEAAVDEKMERLMMPLTLLPSHQLDTVDAMTDWAPSPAAAGGTHKKGVWSADGREGGLLRRKSSVGGPLFGMKRRAIFVPPLSAIFPELALLVSDAHFAVASEARSIIMDLMRNDPSLVTRPVFDLLADCQRGIPAAISTLRAFLHLRSQLPPAMAHHVFNNLAGFLKYAARQVEDADTLRAYAHTLPILSKLITQVSEMSIKEMRRAKVDMFLIPSGSLWFPHTAPSGPMFPRKLATLVAPPESVPPALVEIIMIRLAQNMGILSMLKRKPQDVQTIRKTMSRFVLPSRDPNASYPFPLELQDLVPRKLFAERPDPFRNDPALRGLSLTLSRSYLLLIAQVFRAMSRHLSDRNELAVLVDGLNRILLAHGDDIGVVSQVMIALMVASTRFRRLFKSGGGYTLFMPAVFKVYAESEGNNGIRLAIEYAANRFYALHPEEFVFQTLDVLSHVIMVPGVEGDWIAKNVYSLFAVLRRGISSTTPDAAGIHNSNKIQEQEALIMITAEEKPQTFLAALQTGGNAAVLPSLDLPEEYESNRLSSDDFVRLFLTVIAHDPTISRAEQFLGFLSFLVPFLYNSSSSARFVLKEGIDALATVLTRAAPKTKQPDPSPLRSPTHYDPLANAGKVDSTLENQLLEKSRSPSNIYSMQQSYLSLVVAFARAGGQLESHVSRRTFDLVRIMMKDTGKSDGQRINAFFADYAKATLLRESKPTVREVVTFLTDLAPLVAAYTIAVDFSGVFDTIANLAADSSYASDSAFSQVVVTRYCAAGLDACEEVASQNMLLRFPLRQSLVALMANAMLLHGADAMAEVEKRNPTYQFLTGVILPLVLALKTTGAIVSEGKWNETWRRTVHPRTWVRLVSYVMAARNQKNSRDAPQNTERTKSQEKPRVSGSRMATLVSSIQIIKAIIIKAEADLSSCLPGIWSQIGYTLKSLLSEGNATFALTPEDLSAGASPAQSPRPSLSLNDMPLSHSLSGVPPTPGVGVSFSTSPKLHPRVVDYAMWSLFELICLCRNPLMLQMRVFIQEKVAILDQELRAFSDPGAAARRSRRVSASALFSKPRRRMSGLSNGETSPGLSPSPSFGSGFGSPSLDPPYRQAGYQRFPPSPPGSRDGHGGPKIVHLGPAFRGAGPLSPGLGFTGDNARFSEETAAQRITSSNLVRATYRRIRLVQICMGYDASLLPFPDSEGESDFDQDQGIMWTKKQAMQAIVKEVKELMHEFDELADGDESTIGHHSMTSTHWFPGYQSVIFH